MFFCFCARLFVVFKKKKSTFQGEKCHLKKFCYHSEIKWMLQPVSKVCASSTCLHSFNKSYCFGKSKLFLVQFGMKPFSQSNDISHSLTLRSPILCDDIWDIIFLITGSETATVFCLLFVFFSLQSLRRRRVKSVTAGGQHRHWSVPDCPGHTEHLHHGFQGKMHNINACHKLNLPVKVLYSGTFKIQYAFPHRHSCALTTATVHSWRRSLRSTCVSCRSISQKQPSSRSSQHCAPSSTRLKGLLASYSTIFCQGLSCLLTTYPVFTIL